MKGRCLSVVLVVVVVLLIGTVASAQQPAGNTKPADTQGPIVDLDLAPPLSRAQQKPILLLVRERELLNAKIEGAVLALYAFLGLSPSEWELVTEGDAIKFVRRKPPVPAAQGEKKK